MEKLPKKGDLSKLLDLYQGHDTTMWASDWPHLERDLIAGLMYYDLDDEVRAKILGKNAIEFYGITT